MAIAPLSLESIAPRKQIAAPTAANAEPRPDARLLSAQCQGAEAEERGEWIGPAGDIGHR